MLARDVGSLRGKALSVRFASLATRAGLVRASLNSGSTTLVDVGDRTAIAPGTAILRDPAAGRLMTVTVSELTAAQYARDLAAPGSVWSCAGGRRSLGSSIAVPNAALLPAEGNVTVRGNGYRVVRQTFTGFGGISVIVTVLSALSATYASLSGSRAVAAVVIVAFLALALGFSILASRALQGRLSGFLQAARRLGSGDFSSPIKVEGHDEFAELGMEFNSMSSELSRRLDELTRERVRLRAAIRRTGQTFVSRLDRPALLDLALNMNGGVGEAHTAAVSVALFALGPLESRNRAQGVITVARRGRPFTGDDLDVLKSLGVEAALALENIELHFQVRRQAVTDELTGLANHGRFQELLIAEIEQVRRYHHPIGLIMLDIDDFKAVNDTYGHPQGDAVLRQVARLLQENSRDADSPARYGGEELSLILPHTDLQGAHAIAERIRTAVECLRVPSADGHGVLRITASVGVAASTDEQKDALIAEADGALYEAKRAGKNRTVSAHARAADASGAG